jgi:hypothetical protein
MTHSASLPRHRQPHSAHAAATGEARTSWIVLALLAVAQFMVILDITVVNVALPSIGADLGFTGAGLPWVVSAYVLLTGGLMLLGGRLADLLGRRTVFLTGLGVFTTASLMSGLAWSPAALIGARALQGVGAAMLLPSASPRHQTLALKPYMSASVLAALVADSPQMAPKQSLQPTQVADAPGGFAPEGFSLQGGHVVKNGDRAARLSRRCWCALELQSVHMIN